MREIAVSAQAYLIKKVIRLSHNLLPGWPHNINQPGSFFYVLKFYELLAIRR